jgi:hypothetical protein
MTNEEMTLAALNAEWKEISIAENMEQVKVMVLVKRVIEPESSPKPQPAKSDPR